MDVWTLALTAFPILAWLFVWRKSILFTSIDEDSAAVSGVPTLLHTILLYITLAVSVVLGVKLLGIILVSALLVTPAATSRLFNSSFKGFFTSAIIISEFTVITGLLLSFFVDAPSGAMIILVSSSVFFLVAISKYVLNR